MATSLVAGYFDGGADVYDADGQYRNPTGDIDAFTTSYFHRPDDLATEVTDAGLRLYEIVGVNGIVKLLLPDVSGVCRFPGTVRRDR